MLSRAVTGNAAFFPTLAAAAILVALHWLLAVIAFRFSRFGTLVKGRPRTLIEEGQICWDQMRASHMSLNDLRSALRDQARVEAPEEIKLATLERSGEISVIKRDRPLRFVEVGVRDGVQTVRIEL